MPTTILDGETYEQALHRRCAEEAAFQPTTHTPGPWYAISSDVFKDIGDRRYLVAQCEGWGEETQPNARLIAAAPELLALLERCIEVVEMYCKDAYCLPDARAAIAKATGAKP